MSEEVKQEMSRLRTNQTCIQQTNLDTEPCQFKIVSLNCRSLNKHLQDVSKDSNIKAASVVCFSETRFCSQDEYCQTDLHGYHQYRQDAKPGSSTTRPYHGLAVYSVSPFDECLNLSASNIEVALFKLTHQPDIVFVALYKPPTVKIKHLCDVLEDIHQKYTNRSQCVILGDFNID